MENDADELQHVSPPDVTLNSPDTVDEAMDATAEDVPVGGDQDDAAHSFDDDSEVGHEVAPPRDAPNDVAYYAQLHTNEEDLADNVASDVRRPLSSTSQRQHGEAAAEYEEMPADDPLGAGAGMPQGGHGDASNAVNGEASPAQATSLARQPHHGTQVDADADITPTAAAVDGAPAPPADAGAEPQPSVAVAAAQSSSPIPIAAAGPSLPLPPLWSQRPQAPHGTAEVTVTLLPMQALTRVTVPVHSPSLYRSTADGAAGDGLGVGGGQAGHEDATPYWILVAKELFEALADHLCVHPESFHVYHQHQRLRFMGTLFLDCDVTSASAGDTVEAPLEITQAEPIWISLLFPFSARVAVPPPQQQEAPFSSKGADVDVEEAQAVLDNVPKHLADLKPEDYVARCVRVRRRKLDIPPRTLVEGRRQGYSYDEVIQHMQSVHDAQAQRANDDIADVVGHERGEAATGTTGSGGAASSNFAIVAVVQSGPTPPTKPFLGGYRDKRVPEHVLLHASTQLYHRDLDYSPFSGNGAATAAGSRASRQTQTLGISRSCQTHREACVQTPRVDLHLDVTHDFVVVARPYFSAAAVLDLRMEMAVVIQKLYRGWKARQIRAGLEAAEAVRQHRAGAQQRREEGLQSAVEDAAQLRRDDPRSAADFARVKQDIINWRAEEAARIQRDFAHSPADARAALLAITKKELQLLQQLEIRQREVGKTLEERKFAQTMDRMAAPKQWGTVHVSTPETTRAGELRDLYERLLRTSGTSATPAHSVAPQQPSAMSSQRAVESTSRWGNTGAGSSVAGTTPTGLPSSSTYSPGYHTYSSAASSPQTGAQQQSVYDAAATTTLSGTPTAAAGAAEGLTSITAARLDILLRVKWTVREFNVTSALTRELGELIDREADLLHRGRKDASLSGLRKRIQTLFAQFIEDPEYNPVVKDFVHTARGRARVKAVESEKRQQRSKSQKGQASVR